MSQETFNHANVLDFQWVAYYCAPPRTIEVQQRETAQQSKGCVVVGSGVRGKPKRLAQMVSVRLESLLFRKARHLADHNGITLSDVLREALRRL